MRIAPSAILTVSAGRPRQLKPQPRGTQLSKTVIPGHPAYHVRGKSSCSGTGRLLVVMAVLDSYSVDDGSHATLMPSEMDASALEDHQIRNWKAFLILLALVLIIFALDYVVHPAARKVQHDMVAELKNLPLPRGATEGGFSSGFQPAKGRAEKQFTFVGHIDQLCNFFETAMSRNGWQTEESCATTPDERRIIIGFRKGDVRTRIYFPTQGVDGDLYAAVATWPATLK